MAGLLQPRAGHNGKPDRPTEYVNLFDPWYQTTDNWNSAARYQ
jgi:hypothetical protein